MCPNHHKYFNDYHYFIRFCPEVSLICLCLGQDLQENRIRNSYLSTTLINPFLGSSMARPSPLTSRMAMHRSLPSLSSMRCVSGDIIPSHPFITTCTMTSLGKTGSCRTTWSAMTRVLFFSNVPSRLTIAITVPLRRFNLG